ncbi:MAG: rod-binding protein [Defluviitaleaceae bacterium]|nr:rod-binding protein [Defluviitaleaceae bacterium]MCL2261837.1 rod-binding protein [Defluviitaleaceae bacterium]
MEISNILSSTMDSHAAMMQARSADTEFNEFQSLLERVMSSPAGAIDEAHERAQIRQAAEMFESYFLNMMFRNMRSVNFDEEGFIPRGNAEKIFTEMLDEVISDKAASHGGLGLADMLYAQMTQRFR